MSLKTTLHYSIGFALLAGLVGCSSSSDPAPAPAPVLKVTILQTTDVHHQAAGFGHVDPATGTANLGGYARIAAYVNHVRATTTTHPVVLVDSGDWSMGSLYDLTASSQPLDLYFLDLLKYNCATLGNHEFDYTPAGLAAMLNAANATFHFKTPLVASNITLNGNTDLAPFIGAGKLIPATRTETLANGLKVGYIGLMGKDAAAAAPASAPVTFTVNYAAIQSTVTALRNTENCNIVIALSHQGTDATGTSGEDVDLAKNVTGIDVIAAGHAHNPLATAQAVVNGGWTTQIICAGAYGTNVSRIDVTYNPTTKSVTRDASTNLAMTDSALTAAGLSLTYDPAVKFVVGMTDGSLNAGLSALFTPMFPDYLPGLASKGIYHTVGVAAQDMVSNDKNPVLGPNGMGNLCADANRALPNMIVGQMLMGAGWDGNPANLASLGAAMTALATAGYDPTFYTAGVTATGVIRGSLPAGVPLNFNDIYNVLPLGISPDMTQAIPIGYPLVGAYLTTEDLKKVCALQLVAQTGLAASDYYLNLSGLKYDLDPTALNTYFKYATAAGVLKVTSEKAAGGSTPALAAMTALAAMGSDSGAAMMTAVSGGNPYAIAMAKLNDTDLSGAATNLAVMGEVALTGQTSVVALNALIVNKAIAAITTVYQFGPTDPTCTGPAGPLTPGTRYRVSADLYAIMMMGAVQAQFGVQIIPWSAASGSTPLATMPAILANRINLAPTSGALVETKEWMALLQYLTKPGAQGGLGGTIPAAYASTADFTAFSTFGAAVKTRQASYPLPSIGAFMTTMGTLKATP
jgi:hypothetical protein